MKYLLAYKGFCKFIKEWEVLSDPSDLQDSIIQLQRGQGLIGSHPIKIDDKGIYHGEIHEIKLFQSCYKPPPFSAVSITIAPAGVAGDSFAFSLPIKFHKLKQYHVHYKDTIHQCIMVNENIYRELKTIGLT